ncbi:10645_t:CDS:2 [Gigaspora rosea]|nr:10645_t:CDS:2 [Gigaspora rosea]
MPSVFSKKPSLTNCVFLLQWLQNVARGLEEIDLKSQPLKSVETGNTDEMDENERIGVKRMKILTEMNDVRCGILGNSRRNKMDKTSDYYQKLVKAAEENHVNGTIEPKILKQTYNTSPKPLAESGVTYNLVIIRKASVPQFLLQNRGFQKAAKLARNRVVVYASDVVYASERENFIST